MTLRTAATSALYLFILLCCISCKDDDPAPAKTPTNFFTLKVDPSFSTTENDYWVLASSESGDWIAWEPFESGETKVLNGTVLENGTFTIHFLTIASASVQKFITVNSYASVAAGTTCVLKGVPPIAGTQPKLNLNLTNYTLPANRMYPNIPFGFSCSTGMGGYAGSYSGTTYNYQFDVRKSPADIQVTLYKGGYPYYVRYDNLALPATVNIDASTQGKVADRIFAMNLPDNNEHAVYVEAYNQNDFPFEMSAIINQNGGSQETLGYDNGFTFYRTRVQCSSAKQSRYFSHVGSSVIEQPSLPDFNINVTQKTLSDFKAASSLTFDYATTFFGYATAEVTYLHRVSQPKTSDLQIDFEMQPLPEELALMYPFFPKPNQVNAGTVTGYQRSDFSYDMLLEEEAGSQFNGFVETNVYMFTQQAN